MRLPMSEVTLHTSLPLPLLTRGGARLTAVLVFMLLLIHVSCWHSHTALHQSPLYPLISSGEGVVYAPERAEDIYEVA